MVGKAGVINWYNLLVESKKSPRLGIVVFAVILAVIVIGYAFYTKSAGTAKDSGEYINTERQTINSIADGLRKDSEQDDDGDGLMNWEEALWGTDPQKADSDGDGTNDGEEIRESRNPLIGGEDRVSIQASGVSSVTDNTKTGQISRDLFGNYLQAKRIGVPLDASLQEQIINQAFTNRSLSVEFKPFTPSDIQLAPGNDLKKYGNDLGLAFYAGRTNNTRTEVDILESALVSENRAEIGQLDPIIQGYTAMIAELKSVRVPQSLMGQHLELMNSMGLVLSDIKGFRLIFDDPIVGLASVSNYFNDVDRLSDSISSIKNFLVEENISFEQAEYGYVFFNTI